MNLFQKLMLGAFVIAVLVLSTLFVRIEKRKTRDALRVANAVMLQSALEVGYQNTAKFPLVPNAKTPYGVLGLGAMTKLCLDGRAAVEFKSSQEACAGRTIAPVLARDPEYGGKPMGSPCFNDPYHSCEFSYTASPDGSNFQALFRLEGATGTLQCTNYPCMKVMTKEGIR